MGFEGDVGVDAAVDAVRGGNGAVVEEFWGRGGREVEEGDGGVVTGWGLAKEEEGEG